MECKYSHKDVECREKNRYLSGSESYLHEAMRHEEKFFMLTSVDTFSSKVALSQELIRDALLKLAQRHQLLQSKITSDKNNIYMFEPMNLENMKGCDWLDYRELSVDDVNDWVTVVNEEIKVGINAEGPLWRTILLRSSHEGNTFLYTLIFICHHGIMDGKGVFDLIANQFLPIMNNLLQGVSPLELTKPISMIKSLEEIFFDFQSPISAQPIKWYTRALMSFVLWKQKVFGKDVRMRFPNIRVYEEYQSDLSFKVLPFHMDVEMTSALISYSKQNGVSVNTVLLLALSIAIEELRKYYPLCKPIKKILYATDMRKFHANLSTSPMSCGVFVSTEFQAVKPVDVFNKLEFLNAARIINKDVKSRIKPPDDAKSLQFEGLLYLLLTRDMDVRERLISAIDLDLVVSFSSIGNCDDILQKNDEFSSETVKLVNHYFCGLSPAPICLSACTIREQMRCCIFYNGHWIDQTFAEKLATKMKDIINTLVNI